MSTGFSIAAGRHFRRALCLLALVCGPVAAVWAQDRDERFDDAARLVTIGGALTEIVYRLGEEGRLVARDSTSTYPPSAADLPDIGYMRALSPEGVLSVRPTAILAAEGSGPPRAMDVLEKARVPVIVVPDGFDRQGILRKIRMVGAALGVEDKAAALARSVDADLKAAQEAARAAGRGVRVLFVLSISGGRILAAGRDTAADGIVGMAGGVNAMTGFSGYRQVSEEAVLAARPDVVLMMDRGGDAAGGDGELFAHPAIAGTPAGRRRALVRLEGSYLLGFGPRTAAAVRELSQLLRSVETVN